VRRLPRRHSIQIASAECCCGLLPDISASEIVTGLSPRSCRRRWRGAKRLSRSKCLTALAVKRNPPTPVNVLSPSLDDIAPLSAIANALSSPPASLSRVASTAQHVSYVTHRSSIPAAARTSPARLHPSTSAAAPASTASPPSQRLSCPPAKAATFTTRPRCCRKRRYGYRRPIRHSPDRTFLAIMRRPHRQQSCSRPTHRITMPCG